MDNQISIKCTVKDAQEKKEIKRIFRDNNINMSGFVVSTLRKKAIELEASK